MINLLHGDCIEQMKTLPEGSINTCVTSPPYFGLRSYLPGVVRLKADAPQWVFERLKDLGILPLDHIKE